MIPILYKTMTEGTTPGHKGVGPLTDCLSCIVKEERNGAYELTLEYTADGIHADEIQPLRFIMAKPNFTDNPQIFQIYKVGKVLNGRFSVFAEHISYTLSGKLISSGTASSCAAAVALLEAQAGNFTITTDKTAVGNFAITDVSSVRSWFGGKAGSLLDVFGGGEWKYDNYTASLLNARGMDRGVTIVYGKNLMELSQELNISNLVTGVVPYYIDFETGAKTVGAKRTTGLILDQPRDIAIDFSQDVDPESGTAIATQLQNLADRYISNNNLTTPFNSITLDFVQLEGLTERVDLCDTVKIYYEALGITATAKCVATTWDVLEERYTSTTFGDTRANIADTITNQTKELAQVPSRSYMAETVNRATALITGNLGGYVILHDSNNDGEPDEILIMDTPSIDTSQKIWRWNQNGLGYSSVGYAGPYDTAITANGEIVANFITAGTLNANVIKAGTISDVLNRSTINMATGEATMYNLNARGFVGKSLDGTQTLAELTTISGNGAFRIYRSDGTVGTNIIAGSLSFRKGGTVSCENTSGQVVLETGRDSQYETGVLKLNNSAGSLRARIFASDTSGGLIELYNAAGSTPQSIRMVGQTGNITCVSLTQTSTRKAKDNIKPIDDARKLLELEAVAFDFKNKENGTNKRGFIAEDVAKVLPNLVTPETEDAPAALDYIGMIPYLQTIAKEHEARIKALEEEIEKLKKK